MATRNEEQRGKGGGKTLGNKFDTAQGMKQQPAASVFTNITIDSNARQRQWHWVRGAG